MAVGPLRCQLQNLTIHVRTYKNLLDQPHLSEIEATKRT